MYNAAYACMLVIWIIIEIILIQIKMSLQLITAMTFFILLKLIDSENSLVHIYLCQLSNFTN